LLAVWLTAIVALSLIPLNLKVAIGTTGWLHNCGHLVAFAVFAALLTETGHQTGVRIVRAGAALALAFALELAQRAMYRNDFEWRDVAMDSIGTVLGYSMMLFFTRPKVTQG
jgi:hypothetical protein